jgi:hypothetical protein
MPEEWSIPRLRRIFPQAGCSLKPFSTPSGVLRGKAAP